MRFGTALRLSAAAGKGNNAGGPPIESLVTFVPTDFSLYRGYSFSLYRGYSFFPYTSQLFVQSPDYESNQTTIHEEVA